MESTMVKLEYEICSQQNGGIPAIIVAAGSSSRMGGINKQFLTLGGIPVIVRTLKKFENCKAVSRIILVTRECDISELQLLVEKYALSKLTDITVGGENRHASVLCGMSRLSAEEKKVLIHDGARPFVTDGMICETAHALCSFDAALCAVKINDTVKLASSDGTVTGTLDRSMLYSAQTPQGVDVELYKAASTAAENPESFTDDASVMESAGHSVKIINGSPANIKITTSADISLAEAILEGESICE